MHYARIAQLLGKAHRGRVGTTRSPNLTCEMAYVVGAPFAFPLRAGLPSEPESTTPQGHREVRPRAMRS
jgi:hypothetical protein